jgi:hypothetical protein
MGFSPKGIPRNWLTIALESETEVVVPTTTPLSMVAVGVSHVCERGRPNEAPAKREVARSVMETMLTAVDIETNLDERQGMKLVI